MELRVDPGTDINSCVSGFLSVHQENGNTIRYKAFPVRCKSWDCPTCSRIKAERYKVRMQPLFDSDELYMYTFTFYHSKPEIEVWSEVSKAWNRFRTAAQKKYGRFSYVRILEHHHASDYPHLHCLVDKRFGDVWIAAELKAAGFGYQCKVAKVTSAGAAAYVSKYLTKPWSSPTCKNIRKRLRLRVISFGGTACRSANVGEQWSLLAMGLGCSEALDSIHRDVNWRFGQAAVKTFEETFTDSYEVTYLIPEPTNDIYETSSLLFSP
jgi:hypothetical protein